MKLLILFSVLFPCFVQAQDITGQWHGTLRVQGVELPLVFHVSLEDSTYGAKMDSPAQHEFGIPASATTFENATLSIEIAALRAQYRGKYGQQSFEGIFTQSGHSIPLRLTRAPVEKQAPSRPQEPKPPYSYHSEEVRFPSEGGQVELAGTLTLPAGKQEFPIAILISGSGPQNRDEEIMTHKPFLVLADHLTRNGIAVLRYDDRGFAQSTGNHGSATSADFANDVRAAIAYLNTRNEIDPKRIGLIGHSEGGLVAPMVAADTDLAFIVLLAAPGVPGSEVLLKQMESISRVHGMDEKRIQSASRINQHIFELFGQYGDDGSFESRLEGYLRKVLSADSLIAEGVDEAEFVARQIAQFRSPWMRFFLTYDPADALKRVKCPVLALNGGKDVQVAPGNLAVIEHAVRQGGNANITIKEFPDMNHLFQTCTTGAIDEYATIEQTMDPSVLGEIADWVLKQTK